MPRLLHTADWQIGRAFTTFDPEHAPLLAEARFETVARIAALATERACDAVLVAGDVFDAQTVSDRTIRRLFQALAGFEGPWLMLPGNHDAALAESVWTRAQRLGAVPEHVHLLLTPKPWLHPQRRFVVLPAPLRQRQTVEDLTDWFDGAAMQADLPTELPRIGVAHGSVQGVLAEDIDSPNPIAPDRAATARLDYLALGDWHGCKQIDARTWYAGTPEPDRFKSNQPGHVLLVDLPDTPGGAPNVEPVPVARYRWQTWDAVLQVPSDVDALIDRLATLDAKDVLDLTVSGRVDLQLHDRLRAALGEAEARVRTLQQDLSALEMVPTDDELAALQADGYVGELLAELRDAQSQPDEAQARVARDALHLLADALRDEARS